MLELYLVQAERGILGWPGLTFLLIVGAICSMIVYFS
ncbi:MAG: hypothetical protein ACI81P_001368 [Neolewinella sp.]|jgi:hypothetical protein